MYSMEVTQNGRAPKTNTSQSLSMHKNSQIISKMKPKIRIIHIFAPEIIKTDAENFRELVQRLTGKPTEEENGGSRKTGKRGLVGKKMELRARFRSDSTDPRQKIKGEEDIWGGANSGGGFLGGFSDLDGFMHELSEFPIIPFENSHVDYAYGTTQIA